MIQMMIIIIVMITVTNSSNNDNNNNSLITWLPALRALRDGGVSSLMLLLSVFSQYCYQC